MLSAIAAIDKNRGIGYKNKLLFNLKQDMEFFKNFTMGKSVIMGSNTFKSIGKPLSGRKNYVVTRHPEDLKGAIAVTDFEQFLKETQYSESEVVVMGGASIYEQALPYIKFAYLTEIDDTREADAFFPIFRGDWKSEVIKEGKEDGLKFKIVKYTRGSSSVD